MKVTFDFSGQKIVIEGDSADLVGVLEGARKVAPHLTEISIQTTQAQGASGDKGGGSNGGGSAGGRLNTTLKHFVKKLNPSNTAERIAAIAYYAKHQEQRDSFSPKEMDSWFAHASQTKPAQMPVAFFDAKKRYGYIESIGHGKWRLDTQGENFITSKLNQMEE